MYDLTMLENATTFVSVTDYINVVTDTWFFFLMICCIFIILLLSLKRYGFAQGLATSGFVCFILSLMLNTLGYVNTILPVAFIIISVLTTMYLYITNG